MIIDTFKHNINLNCIYSVEHNLKTKITVLVVLGFYFQKYIYIEGGIKSYTTNTLVFVHILRYYC